MSFFQKHTKNGKPVVNNQGLPMYNKPVDHRLKVIKNILTIGLKPDEEKWWHIQQESRRIIGFNT